MVDIPIVIGPAYSLDICAPSLLAQPIDNSQDLTTAILLSLGTDRVVDPATHYGLASFDRRGSWQDAIVDRSASGQPKSRLPAAVRRGLYDGQANPSRPCPCPCPISSPEGRKIRSRP